MGKHKRDAVQEGWKEVRTEESGKGGEGQHEKFSRGMGGGVK